MNNTQVNNACLFNTLYIQYVEDIGQNEYFYYNLKYPVIYNVKNGYFQVNEDILKNLNETIRSSVYTFKNGILEEEQQINTENSDGNKTKTNYKVFSNYDLTFNKNHVLSLTLHLTAMDNDNLQYNELYSYNMDLLTGNQILLKDVFRPGVDYLKLVSDFVNFKISQNPSYYYPNTVAEIPEAQSFYLTDQGIVIYFGLDEVSPASNGIQKFLMEFTNFESYINSRFYCNAKNMNYNKKNRRPQHNRMYY
ncbi:MAG TPA: DUF3298 domain-containing protein [Terrisporobacter glycolicus]|uniref:DUF3298 and DUF4163 domain-containing protein n=1 Tax=Terrisporobacter TaxID=1505652 RepID=UPI000E8E56A0|nr:MULTISPECIES: DUF3298 and DUF4163 domain-containing protein [Terrisporobacter]HBI92686.1 DUF3298 domain-containing protein [Terrisporobacter hibernicus]